MADVDVGSLSDLELRDALMAHGVDVGPILPTTRNLYVKKLRTLMNGGAVTPKQQQANGSPRGSPMRSHEDEEESVAQFTPTRPQQSTPRREPVVQAPVFDDVDDDGHESDCDYRGEESFRVINRSLNGSQLCEEEPAAGSQVLKMFFVVAVIVVGTVFAFFVFDRINTITGGNNEEL